GVLYGCVVDREPDSYHLRRSQRPVTSVLVPRDALAVAGHLAEEVRAPGDDVLTQQVGNVRHDPRMGEQVVDTAVAEMRRADRVAVATGGEGAGEQIVEVGADLVDLREGENPDALQVPVVVKVVDQRFGEDLLVGDGRGVKAQVTVEGAEFATGGDESGLVHSILTTPSAICL